MAITTAKGTLVQIGDGASPEVFSTIGQVRSVTRSASAEIVDITTHATAGNYREKLAVLVDPGETTFSVNWDIIDATHNFATGLWAHMTNLRKRGLRIIFPGIAGTILTKGYVSNHSFSAPIDNVLSADITVANTGAITAA